MKTLGRMLLPALSLVLVLGPLACGDDKNPTGPGTIGESDAGTAQALLYGVVSPLVRNILLEDYVLSVSEPGLPVAQQGCEPLTVCTSGAAEFCSDTATLTVNFTTCDLGTHTVDGTVSLTLGLASGTGTLDMSIDGNAIVGNVSYSALDNCFSQYFTDVVITAGGYTIGMNGGVFWCDPRSMIGDTVVPTSGNFEFTIQSLNRLFDVNLFSEPVGDIEIVVLNLSRTQSYTACHGSILGSSLSCFSTTE